MSQTPEERLRQEIAAKLAASQESRLSERERKRKDAEDQKDPNESIHKFTGDFNQRKQEILDLVNGCRSCPADQMSGQLYSASKKIQELQEFVSSASFFLPPYDVRQALESTSKLQAELDAVKASVAPAKKFSFARKKPTSDASPSSAPSTAPAPVPAPESASVPVSTSAASSSDAPTVLASSSSVASSEVSALHKSPDLSFSGLSDQLLVKEHGSLNGADFVLASLERCVVFICDWTSALRIEGLRDCLVFAGPVARSIHLENCHNCTFVLSSQQIRIHTSRGLHFHLLVRSKPIIEHTSGVMVSPFCFEYEQMDQDFESARFDRSVNNWSEVEDFNWLRRQHSPNWDVLAEEKRMALVRYPTSLSYGDLKQYLPDSLTPPSSS